MELLAVTGANGAIGREVVLQALQGDHARRVRLLVRRQSEFVTRTAQAFPDRVEVVIGDVLAPTAAAALARGASAVVHAAALTREQAGAKRIHATNIEGAVRVAEAAAHAGARLVHLSTSAVYGEAAGTYAEDADLARAELATHYARSKREAEARLRALAGDRDLGIDILRPTIVYGPLCSWTVDVVALILKGVPLVVSGGGVPIDAIHVSDVARAVLLSAGATSSGVRVFNVGSGPGPTWGQFFSVYESLLRKKVRTFPPALFRLLARLVPPFRVLHDMQLCPKEYDRTRAREELGFEARTGLGAGFEQVGRWLSSIAHHETNGTDAGVLAPLARRLADVRRTPFAILTPTHNRYVPTEVLHASSEREVQKAVNLARNMRWRLRPHGRLHSFAPLPDGREQMLNVDTLSGLVRREGPLLTVRAGTHLHDAVQLALPGGMTLPNLGAQCIQSVSGAVSTGIHGSSLVHGGISDAVEGVRLVRADGEAVSIVRGDPDWPAAALGLGLLGVLTEVTFRCVPQFWLEEHRQEISPAELTDTARLLAWPAKHEFVELNWYIRSGAAFALTRSRVPEPAEPVNWIAEPQRYGRLEMGALTWFTKYFGDAVLQRPIEHAVVRRLWERPVRVDAAHKILSIWRTNDSIEFPSYNVAVAVPLANAAQAIRDVFDLLHRHPIRPFLLERIQIRFQPRSEAWLSPAYGEPVCWVEFWVHRTAVPPGLFEWLCEALQETLAPYGHRPHWAKHGARTREHLSQVLPRYEDFVALRRRYDPRGMFMNPMLEKLFA